VFGNPLLDRVRISERAWKGLLLPLALLGLLVSFAVRNPQFQETIRYSLQGLCLFPLFIVAVRFPDWFAFRLLNLGWMRFLGVLSYSIYLLHPTVLWAVTSWTRLPGVVQAAIGLVLTLAIALVIYEIVEKPAAQLRRKLSRITTAAGERTELPVGPELGSRTAVRGQPANL
jgi:peptidoglycan/LPS O-acetylase OafA/YrhL